MKLGSWSDGAPRVRKKFGLVVNLSTIGNCLVTVFTKNRKRLLVGDVAQGFFNADPASGRRPSRLDVYLRDGRLQFGEDAQSPANRHLEPTPKPGGAFTPRPLRCSLTAGLQRYSGGAPIEPDGLTSTAGNIARGLLQRAAMAGC